MGICWSTMEKTTHMRIPSLFLLPRGISEQCKDPRWCRTLWQCQKRSVHLVLLSLLSALHLLLFSFYLTGTFINELRPFVPQAHKRHLTVAISFFTPPFRCLIPISHTFLHDREHLLLCVCTVPSKQGPASGYLVGYCNKRNIKKVWQHEDSAERSLRYDFMLLPFCLVLDYPISFTEYQMRSLQQKCTKKRLRKMFKILNENN